MDLFSTNWDTKKFQTCFIIILFCAVSNKIQIGSCPRFNLIKNIEILSDTSVHKSLKNTSFYIHFICLKLMESYGQGWKKNHSCNEIGDVIFMAEVERKIILFSLTWHLKVVTCISQKILTKYWLNLEVWPKHSELKRVV